MRKLLLTVGTFLTLAACTQDKFEQIDANFAYQQEQLEALDTKIDTNVSELNARIDDNTDFILNVQSEIAVVQENLEAQLEDATASLTDYVDGENAIQDARIEALDLLLEVFQGDINFLNNNLNALEALTLQLTAQNAHNIITNSNNIDSLSTNIDVRLGDINSGLQAQFLTLSTDLIQRLNNVSAEVKLQIADVINQLELQGTIIEVYLTTVQEAIQDEAQIAAEIICTEYEVLIDEFWTADPDGNQRIDHVSIQTFVTSSWVRGMENSNTKQNLKNHACACDDGLDDTACFALNPPILVD